MERGRPDQKETRIKQSLEMRRFHDANHFDNLRHLEGYYKGEYYHHGIGQRGNIFTYKGGKK